MGDYVPPFRITAKSISLIAEISAQVERYAIRMEQSDALMLRKANRIKTIQGSLAIEGNTLSEEQITAILEGKHVIAPKREVQEVRNAIKTYERSAGWKPYSLKDLLAAHESMMTGLIDEAGKFRQGGVGVFAGTDVIHLAPPADRVPLLMKDLLEWLERSDDHPLVKSSVFHYELEFILASILEAITSQREDTPEVTPGVTPEVAKLLHILTNNEALARKELQERLGLKDEKNFRQKYLAPALAGGHIEMTIPEKPNSRFQKYRRQKK